MAIYLDNSATTRPADSVIAAMDEAMQMEKFFHSGWYEILTDVDPDYLIRKLREKVAA